MTLAAARTAALVGWLLLCVPPHVLAILLTRRSRWPRRFLAGVARIAGVRLTVVGRPADAGTLLVSNHRSWLDIPVLAAAAGAAFVAKVELEGHWLLRWLCEQNGTVFIDRRARRSVGAQASAVEQALRRERPLVLFAEGTVAPDAPLLPFRSPLLAAAVSAPDDIVVRPIAIDYGPARADLAWRDGESGIANFRKVMGRPGRLPARVQLLPALPPTSDRKALARAAQIAIEHALALSEPDALPYSGGES